MLEVLGFLCSSAGKESTCNAGDPGSIPGSGRSPGEGIVYPFQYSWTSLVAHTVKNLPAVQEAWVPSLGWEDPWMGGMATHSSILAWRIPKKRGAWQATVHGATKSWTRLTHTQLIYNIVLVSGVQQSDSVLHMHVDISILFQFLFSCR